MMLTNNVLRRKETEERLEQVLDDWSRSLELISKLEGEINMFKRKGKKIRQTSSKKLLCVSSDNYDATDDTSLPSFGAMVCSISLRFEFICEILAILSSNHLIYRKE